MKADEYVETSKLVKHYKLQISDHNKNKWNVVELSDLPEILEDFAEKERKELIGIIIRLMKALKSEGWSYNDKVMKDASELIANQKFKDES